MKRTFYLKALLFAMVFHLNAEAQQSTKKQLYSSTADSLINEFQNSVYTTIYNPAFWSKCNTPVFTILKVDIDDKGSARNIKFSDSADTSFLIAYSQRVQYHDDISTLTKYAKAKSYKGISILIPIYYEPNYSGKKHPPVNDKPENMMQFGNTDFTGIAVMLAPIKIRVLPEHNM